MKVYENYKKEISLLMSDWRARMGYHNITKADLATKSGISYQTIRKCLNGEVQPSEQTMDAIEKVLPKLP